jgi:DNA-binding protein H-NS
MKKLNFEGMPLDDLWALHEQLSGVLASRITAEKQQLEERLIQLNSGKINKPSAAPILNSKEPKSSKAKDRPRRKYPKVSPKYQNPAVPTETWSGRGKQPRWLVSALKSGRTIKEFEIVYTDDRAPAKAVLEK